MNYLRWYSRLLVLGVAVHELAHAVAVMLSGGEIIEFDVTSHIKHKGRYSLLQQLCIGYAPLVGNSAGALAVARVMMWFPESAVVTDLSASLGETIPEPVLTVLLQAVLLLTAFSLGAAALPSFEDAESPYRGFQQRLARPTLSRLFILPLVVPFLLVFLVPLGFTYLRSKSRTFQLLTEIAFAMLLILHATGTVVIVDVSYL